MDRQHRLEEFDTELQGIAARLAENRSERARLDLEAQNLEIRRLELLEEILGKMTAELRSERAETAEEMPQNASRWRPIHSEFDRCKQISKIVGESKEILEKPDDERISTSAVIGLFEESAQLLYTHQDYPEHLKPALANDFADLPNEIIYEVIEYEVNRDNETELRNLALIDGSWAECGKEFMMSRSLRYNKVNESSDFANLKANASQLYEFIAINELPKTTLELIGTRFSTVDWSSGYRQSGSLDAIIFLKRQLNSKYLRRLKIRGVETEQLKELLLDFVKRPHFEELDLGSAYELDELYELPFEVIAEAHKAWKATERFVVRSKKIEATICMETLQKLESYFESTLPVDATDIQFDHPLDSAAKTNLKVFKGERNVGYTAKSFVDLCRFQGVCLIGREETRDYGINSFWLRLSF